MINLTLQISLEITHIRLSDISASGTERIQEVKLSDDTVQTVETVIQGICSDIKYYYTTSAPSYAEVEVLHPRNRKPYIRTKGNRTESDNLLNLPRF